MTAVLLMIVVLVTSVLITAALVIFLGKIVDWHEDRSRKMIVVKRNPDGSLKRLDFKGGTDL